MKSNRLCKPAKQNRGRLKGGRFYLVWLPASGPSLHVHHTAMKLPLHDLLGLIVATSFAAGLNVYATVATLGLLARSNTITLPASLQLLASWYVIAAAIVLFAVEFFADKIPAFDLIWNALHTFIRVPVAALIAWRATAQLSPGEQLLATVAGGLIALVAHGGKTAARAAVTPFPEPFSNAALSTGEDAVAIGLTWFATRHPWIAGSLALIAVLILIIMIRWIVRALGVLFCAAKRRLTAPDRALASPQ